MSRKTAFEWSIDSDVALSDYLTSIDVDRRYSDTTIDDIFFARYLPVNTDNFSSVEIRDGNGRKRTRADPAFRPDENLCLGNIDSKCELCIQWYIICNVIIFLPFCVVIFFYKYLQLLIYFCFLDVA